MKRIRKILLVVALSTTTLMAAAQGNSGIQSGADAITQVTSDLQSYFEPVTWLVYIIAAIVGLFGGLRIYSKWQNGEQDVQKSAVGWVGAILFLLAIAFVLESVFFL